MRLLSTVLRIGFMSELSAYPAVPSAFFVQRTPGKARLFTGQLGPSSGSLSPVTTVSTRSDSEVDRLISTLTTAAWHGDRRSWETLAVTLPDAVVLACNQALAAMPPPEALALGSDGLPMTLLREQFELTPGGDDLATTVSAAYDLSLQALLDNYRNSDGEVRCRVRLLSGEAEVTRGSVVSTWPTGDGTIPTERHLVGPADFGPMLKDPRWRTHRVRSHWVWLTVQSEDSESYVGEATWIVEFFDQEVPDDLALDDPADWELFVEGNWNPWPMTARTRFVLWNSLIELQAMLELGLSQWDEGNARPQDDDFMQDYPAIVRSQPHEWWNSMLEACVRLIEAMRTGEHWNPRTPAEEALIHVACQDGWLSAAEEIIESRPVLRRQLAGLPKRDGSEPNGQEEDDAEAGPDFDWDEVPGALAGDEDIALLWMPEVDGVGDPEDPINRAAGIGDYRAASWHQPFDRYRQDPDAQSAIY